MLVVVSLQVPGDQLGDACVKGGAEGHSVASQPIDNYLGNGVLTAAQYGAQIKEGGGAEEFYVDDFTTTLIWVPDRYREVNFQDIFREAELVGFANTFHFILEVSVPAEEK